MEKLLEESAEFLVDINDDAINVFNSSLVTEHVIPKTRKAIANFVLGNLSSLKKSNNRMRLIAIPFSKTIGSILDKEVVDPYYEFFYKEKETILLLQSLLHSKKTKLNGNMPIASTAGIFTQMIGQSHLINQDQLTKIITSSGATANGFSVQLSEKTINPVNLSLVKRLNTKLREEINKK